MEGTPFKQGHILYKACGRCKGDMSFQTYINLGERTHDFFCLQCGNEVPLDLVLGEIELSKMTGEPLCLKR